MKDFFCLFACLFLMKFIFLLLVFLIRFFFKKNKISYQPLMYVQSQGFSL